MVTQNTYLQLTQMNNKILLSIVGISDKSIEIHIEEHQ